MDPYGIRNGIASSLHLGIRPRSNANRRPCCRRAVCYRRGVLSKGIASWNGSSWSALGSGISLGGDPGSVFTLAVMPNGMLLAGGGFSHAGSVINNSISMWNGVTWSALFKDISIGAIGRVTALAESTTNDLVAGGFGGGNVSISNIARWNGSTWSPLETGTNHPPSSLITLSSSFVVAAGDFTEAGGVSVDGIAQWDGSTWSPLPTGNTWLSGRIHTMKMLPGGDLIAGGDIVVSEGGDTFYYGVARWNGATWSSVGDGVDGTVHAITTLSNGDLIVGGSFVVHQGGDILLHNIARWNGSTWSSVGSLIGGAVYALASLPNDDIVAAGNFHEVIGGNEINNIARWNGSTWSPLGTGINGYAHSLLTLPNGDIVAAGDFGIAGGIPVNFISIWNGQTWSSLDSGIDSGLQSSPTSLNAVTSLSNGELVVGGSFYTAGEYVSIDFARYSFTGIPTVSIQPLPQSVEPGDTITLTATPSNGYSNVSVQWYRNGEPLTDGQGGASTDGGMVSGASVSLPSPTRLSTATLSIANAQPSDAGDYTAVFFNSCGGVTSTKATVSVEPPCPADFNRDGGIDGADVAAFFDAWEAGDASADVNQDGGVDGSDAQTFFNAWKAGGCE